MVSHESDSLMSRGRAKWPRANLMKLVLGACVVAALFALTTNVWRAPVLEIHRAPAAVSEITEVLARSKKNSAKGRKTASKGKAKNRSNSKNKEKCDNTKALQLVEEHKVSDLLNYKGSAASLQT